MRAAGWGGEGGVHAGPIWARPAGSGKGEIFPPMICCNFAAFGLYAGS